MKTLHSALLISASLLALLVWCAGCDRHPSVSAKKQFDEGALIERRMAQFAASNGATLFIKAPTNWPFALTLDIEDSFKKDGKPTAIEVILPDVRREENGELILDAGTLAFSIDSVRVEAEVSTNMLPQIRAARSQLGSLWLILKVDSVRKR